MWIRSQDKMELVPINSKLYIPISKTGEDFGIFHEETMLGHYKSKERALEVLNMIGDVFNDGVIVYRNLFTKIIKCNDQSNVRNISN